MASTTTDTAAAATAASTVSKSKQIPIVCPGHTRPLAELQFCSIPDENNRVVLASACHDAKPMLRDGRTGDWIGTFAGHKGAVWSCRLDASGSLCATASGDFSVHVWDAITGELLYNFPHQHIVKTCDFSPNSQYLASGGHEGLVRVYDLVKPDAEPITIDVQDGTAAAAAGGAGAETATSKKIGITKLNWLDNSTILAGCADGMLRVWKIDTAGRTSSLARTVPVQAGAEIRDMELTAAGERRPILTIAAGQTVYFYDITLSSFTFQLLQSHKMPMHFRDEGGASLHPDGQVFVAGGSDLWVRVFDFATGAELEHHKGHHGPIRCVRFHPDGTQYATGSEDGTIRLWKTVVAEEEEPAATPA